MTSYKFLSKFFIFARFFFKFGQSSQTSINSPPHISVRLVTRPKFPTPGPGRKFPGKSGRGSSDFLVNKT